jgi:5-methylcytosine-specific restriction protein A
MSVSKNPTWVRDEIILALDLYFHLDPKRMSKTNPEIVSLSDLLNELPVHGAGRRNQKFRNPAGVHMKLRNFMRFDTKYSGRGLQRGGKLEEYVWKEFADDRAKLHAAAQAIKDTYKLFLSDPLTSVPDEDEEEVFPEGKILSRLHRFRERNANAVKRKKERTLAATGKLACEVCGFDFHKKYGELGYGYAECHHTTPLSLLNRESSTRLSDLAIVCANCHRMLHRSREWLTIVGLKQIIVNREH